MIQQSHSWGYTQRNATQVTPEALAQPMFIVALFTIARLWKQLRCPTADEWIKKMWCLYTMEFYSATKKNEILSFTSKWMELENIILCELRHRRRVLPHMQIIVLKQMQKYYWTWIIH
jgi:hypothetical protein